MSRRVLFFAWEYPGVHSVRGTALSRRVGQLVRGFAEAGWHVDVVHRRQRPDDEACGVREPIGPPHVVVRRFSIPGPGIDTPLLSRWTAPGRVLATAYHGWRQGDRSGQWAREAARLLPTLPRPDLVIGCFTPRGPLGLARQAHERWDVPWIADLQDPALEGCSRRVAPLVARWMSRTLESASSVVQVGPEWAATDARLLKRPVITVRHAIPDAPPRARADTPRPRSGAFVLLYAGSLDPRLQDASLLMSAVETINGASVRPSRRVVVRVAGLESVRDTFRAQLGSGAALASETLEWLGWLDATALRKAMQDSDCLVLIPWFDPSRVGAPSKLYEYAASGKPVLIAGRDAGGTRSLLSEWGHPNVIADTPDALVESLERAIRGDPERLFRIERCALRPPGERELAVRYLELAADAIDRHLSREAVPTRARHLTGRLA